MAILLIMLINRKSVKQKANRKTSGKIKNQNGALISSQARVKLRLI